MSSEQGKKIDIIIPIYNTPFSNLKACIDSIIMQEYEEFEVILVDDGSECKCAEGIDLLAQNDSRMRVIHQKNGGVSKARNTGIMAATAPYIAFVDADDIIPANFLKEASGYIEQYAPDIIFGTLEYVPEREIVQHAGCMEEFYGNQLEEVKKSLLGIEPRQLRYRVLGTPCGRIYKTEIAEKVLFSEGVPLCEDQLFNRRMLNSSDKVLIVPETWYYYIQNEFSAMHKTMKKSYFKMAKPYWDELLIINKEDNPEFIEQLRIMALGLFYTAIQKDYFESTETIFYKVKEIKKIAKHPLICDAVRYLKISSDKLRFSQKIGLFFMKRKLFFLLYFSQRIKYRKGISGRE